MSQSMLNDHNFVQLAKNKGKKAVVCDHVDSHSKKWVICFLSPFPWELRQNIKKKEKFAFSFLD
jgi:hypothetical protein